MTRREYLNWMAVGAAVSAASDASPEEQLRPGASPAPQPGDADREARMKWWHEARFGMFIHWGLYSTLGRHEWVMEEEGIPVAEYEQQAKLFKPKPNAARDWARLAKQAGQKYMVMTTKHHEGFCNFDSKLTNYNAAQQGPGRDLVKEYVEAARAEGLRVGFYYSLMDWHHPDGARCKSADGKIDEPARRRFVDYIHGHVRELLTNYGKIDILWYDVNWPLNAQEWESEKMNDMVYKLQPEIIVNDRNGLPGDFTTPEQTIRASTRAWESCMTMNGSWGYQRADDNWKTPKTIVRNLVTCSHDTGNYLLNIGPKADGSIPEESVRILTAVGKWMEHNGSTIYKSDKCQPRASEFAEFSRQANTLFMHVHFWPGSTVSLGGLRNKVKSARLLAGGKDVKFDQDDFRVRFTGLPEKAPDDPVTTIAIECDGEPNQDTSNYVRRERPRRGVGV
ncbi:MAG: alpha-L-fucosidase [Bryobacteraceae bacterium]